MGISNHKLNYCTSNKFWGIYKEYDYQTILNNVSYVYNLKKMNINKSTKMNLIN